MLEAFWAQRWITAIILFLLLLSVGIQVMIGVIYQNMIKETENMSVTRNKLLKQCKLKFVNCYRMNMGVANIPIFVDKFLGRLSLGKVSIRTLYHLSGQLMLLSVFFAGVGASRSLIAGMEFVKILPFYIISFLGLYLYFSVSSIVDIRGKSNLLKVNLVDYLENHMANRLAMPEMEEEQVHESEYKKVTEPVAERKAPKSQQALFSKTEEKELEELLKELLA